MWLCVAIHDKFCEFSKCPMFLPVKQVWLISFCIILYKSTLQILYFSRNFWSLNNKNVTRDEEKQILFHTKCKHKKIQLLRFLFREWFLNLQISVDRHYKKTKCLKFGKIIENVSSSATFVRLLLIKKGKKSANLSGI